MLPFRQIWMAVAWLHLLVSVVLLVFQPRNAEAITRREAQMKKFQNYTRIIDAMLDPSQYNRRLRPNMGGKPVIVKVDLYVKSMGPASEIDMNFQIDCYFRQVWVDPRLSYNVSGIENMVLATEVLEKIWTPDTYIANGKGSYLHTITVPNKLVRIKKSGEIYYSQRLTVKTRCYMQLQRYPLDSQECPIVIESFGYSNKDVIYLWKNGDSDSVKTEKGLRLSQFDIARIDGTHWNSTIRGDPLDSRSRIEVRFYLLRATGYYLLNIYIPCAMLVVISWVPFWINREASAARTGLGVTTILTSVTIGMTGRADLPQLAYITALDLFLIVSFFYVTAALLEYAGVNYFTKLSKPDDCKPAYAYTLDDYKKPEDDVDFSILPSLRDGCFRKFSKCLMGSISYKDMMVKRKHEMNAVSKIDYAARIIFPVSFTLINGLYWFVYLYL